MSHKLILVCVAFQLLAGTAFGQTRPEQENAVKAIRKAGGTVSALIGVDPPYYSSLFCDEHTDMAVVLKEIHHLRDLQYVQLVKVATDEHLKALSVLSRVNTFNLAGSKVTDEGMKHVARHEGVEDLLLGNTKVGDAGLKELTKLKYLRRLFMTNTAVSDKGMKELAKIARLEELAVGADLTDEGMKEISQVTRLTSLSVAGDKISGTGLKHLAPLKKLRALSIISNQLGDDDLQNLLQFSELSTIALRCPKISDKGLVHLVPLNLGGVFLPGSQITDTGILQLVGMTKLRQLNVRDTRVTEAGQRALIKLRPNVTFLD